MAASESATDIFGFELVYALSASQVSKKEDVLVVVTHWYLIKNGFKCLGSGDAKTIGPNEEGSELLPSGWSQAQTYSLRYAKESKLYILMVVKSDNDVILNLLKVESHAVSSVQFPIDIVRELQGPLAVLIPDYDQVLNSLKNSLIADVYTSTGVEISTQTSDSQANRQRRNDNNDDDPLRVGPPQRPPGHMIPGPNPVDPFGIGRDDLNPFGQRGGGMLFDPFNPRRGPGAAFPGIGIPGRLPPGAVPPNARFDPFGPVPIDPQNPRRNVPDADHMPPPGYDDMFM